MLNSLRGKVTALIAGTLVALLSACGDGNKDQPPISPPVVVTERTTVMVYSIVSNLTSGTDDLIQELRALKSTTGFNIILQTGGGQLSSKYRVNNRYRVDNNGQLVALAVDPNAVMTTTSALRDFISSAKVTYPADRYHLILVNHGGYGYYGQDDRDKSKFLRPSDIAQVVRDAGIKLGIIGFDTCLLATATAAKDFQAVAEYFIASEEIGWSGGGSGWDFTKLQGLKNFPSAYEATAMSIVDGYMARNIGRQKTASVIKLANISAYLSANDVLAQRLTALLTSDAAGNEVKKRIANARKQSYSFGSFLDDDFVFDVDALSFLQKLKAQNIGAATNSQIDITIASLQQAIIYSKQMLTPSANGLSVVIPTVKVSSEIDRTVSASLSMVNSAAISGFINQYKGLLKQFKGAVGAQETTTKVISGIGCIVGITCKLGQTVSHAVGGKVSGVADKPDELQAAFGIIGPNSSSAVLVQKLDTLAGGQYSYTWDRQVYTLNGLENVVFLSATDAFGERIGRMPFSINNEKWIAIFSEKNSVQTLLSLIKSPAEGEAVGGQMTVETVFQNASASVGTYIGTINGAGEITTVPTGSVSNALSIQISRKAPGYTPWISSSAVSHSGEAESSQPLQVQ